MASPLVPPPVVKAKALYCPNCGGPVERRGFGYTLSVVCPQCLTVLDASTPLLTVLQQVESKERYTPIVPLGSRGQMEGATWEAIGYQRRGVPDDAPWEEYLLFNPYKGFRYLIQYDGHWTLVKPLEVLPGARDYLRTQPVYEGKVYKHFSSGQAVTRFVLGEFPWRVKVGDKVLTYDYVNPPSILSAEATPEEITWSKGEYVKGQDVWKAFKLPGSPPPARGVYLNQPSPYSGKVGGIWAKFGWMLLVLLGLALFFTIFSKRQTVFQSSYQFASTQQGEPSFVTKEFQLAGRPAPVEVAVRTNLDNNWSYFNFALINQDTGEAYDFGKEVSYYYGTDSDGSWSEGGPAASVLIPAVPPGRYYLRVEPEMEKGRMSYDLTVRYDVPSYLWFWIAAALLLIPPVIYSIRAMSFERQRWAESDHPPVKFNSSD